MRVPRCRWRVLLRRQRLPAAVPVLLLAAVLFAGFRAVVSARLEPAVESMAVSGIRNRIAETVSAAAADCLSDRGMSDGDFISIETDDTGRITSLTRDLAAESLLRRDLVDAITDALEPLGQESFGIPLGTLTGWIVFSGRGPSVRVRVLSFGDVEVQISQEFAEAGINQTSHQVFLDVSVTVYLLIPGDMLSVEADSRICVAETVIVGQVPDTYLYLGNGENQYG